jgi:hypothetical protein
VRTQADFLPTNKIGLGIWNALPVYSFSRFVERKKVNAIHAKIVKVSLEKKLQILTLHDRFLRKTSAVCKISHANSNLSKVNVMIAIFGDFYRFWAILWPILGDNIAYKCLH